MRGRLLLYMSAVALGVAALVALGSFERDLRRSLATQGADILGADLTVATDIEPTPAVEAFLDSLEAATGAETAREVQTASVALATGTDRTRLVRVHAVEGRFPFYGAIETTPAEAARGYQRAGAMLADRGLMLQLGVEVGDTLRIGRQRLPIAAAIDRVPGVPDIGAAVAPRVYMPLAALDTTLLGFGSRANYVRHYRIEGEARGDTADAIVERLRPRFQALDLRTETASEAEGDWAESLSDLARFLRLVGFIALLLGGLGVASAVGVYVREKEESVATLRCLGLKARGALAVYALQATALGLLGAGVGAILGIVVQQLLPGVLGTFAPVDVVPRVAWVPVAAGLGVGLAFALAFALLPLVGVRRVPPLRAIRVDTVGAPAGRRRWRVDPLQALIGVLLAVGVGLFAWGQTGEWEAALAFPIAAGVAVAALALVARALRALARRVVRPGWPFPWRQGVAALFRPGNQTTVLLLTLGLGAFLLLTLALVQRALLEPALRAGSADARADLILWGVPKYDREAVAGLIQSEGFPVIDNAVAVPMRLTRINGQDAEALARDSTRDGPPERWAVNRPYQSTFRDHLVDSEEIVEGEFVGRVAAGAGVVPVSVEQELAGDLGVEIGDRLTWDVEGLDVETEVRSLREVDWQRVQPNFFVVFPEGPLNEAPQSAIITTQAGGPEESARLQRVLVERFPSVSAVDVRQVLESVRTVLDQVAFVLRFMAAFALGTGLIVLAGAVRVARRARASEGVLLRTLGADRTTVRRAMTAEYAALGLLAAIAGAILSVAAGWALARFAFDTPFVMAWDWLLGAAVAGPLLTVAVGLVGSRGLLDRPPLDVLREEV
jgi:putative ABC transport system permease protein